MLSVVGQIYCTTLRNYFYSLIKVNYSQNHHIRPITFSMCYKLAGFKNFIGFAIYIHKNKS